MYRVILMEIRDNYCLAMTDEGEIIRIVLKPGISVGDKVFVLDEDIYTGSADRKTKLDTTDGISTIVRSKRSLAGLAAAFLIVLSTFIMYLFPNDAYAMISFDSNKSIQIELDDDFRIISVAVRGETDTVTSLSSINGKSLEDLEDELIDLIRDSNTPVILAYALNDEGDLETDKRISGFLSGFSKKYEVLLLKGSKSDMAEAQKRNESLGILLTHRMIDEDRIEELLEQLSLAELLALFNSNPILRNHPELLDEIEDRLEDDISSDLAYPYNFKKGTNPISLITTPLFKSDDKLEDNSKDNLLLQKTDSSDSKNVDDDQDDDDDDSKDNSVPQKSESSDSKDVDDDRDDDDDDSKDNSVPKKSESSDSKDVDDDRDDDDDDSKDNSVPQKSDTSDSKDVDDDKDDDDDDSKDNSVPQKSDSSDSKDVDDDKDDDDDD